MRETPVMFHSLELEYIINGQSSARRRISVSGQTLMGGQLMTELENMAGADSSGERYVTSADLKAIVSESATNVVASVITDADYVDTGDEVSVKNLLERVLGRDEVAAEDFEPRMWSSVFWNPDWARPDKYASFLNEVLTKDESDSKNFILNEEAYSKSSSKSGSSSFFKISGSAKKGKESSGSTKVQKEDLLKTLRERNSHVEWTGEVFRAKPLKLHRINLSELNSTATIAVVNMQIHK